MKTKNEKNSNFYFILKQKSNVPFDRRIKMVVSYLNLVFFIEVKAKSKYRILNFVFQFLKKTKWHFGYTDSRSLKNIEMFPEAAAHSLKSKRYIQKQLCKFFRVSAQNIHTLNGDFLNLSMIMKTSLMDGLKIQRPCMNAIGRDITLILIGR